MRVVNLPTRHIVALLAGMFVVLGMLAPPRTAEACSPPLPGIYASAGSFLEQPVPTDGAWALRVSVSDDTIDSGNLTIEVSDEAGAPVEGTISHVLISPGESGPPGRPPSYLVIWKPTDVLLPGRSYTVDVRAVHPYDDTTLTIDEQVTFEAISGEHGAPAAAAAEASLGIVERPGGQECCDTGGEICDSCTGECGSAQRCWFTRYAYLPTIYADVAFPDSPTDLQSYHIVQYGDEDTRRFYWGMGGDQNLNRSFAEDSPGPFCVTIESFALATSELINSEEFCFERSDLPDYTARTYNGEGWPDECLDTDPDADAGSHPDAGSNDAADWGDASSYDGGNPDAASENISLEGDDLAPNSGGGCACRIGGASPVGIPGAFLLLLALIATRGRRLFGRDVI
jgi:hypothetical protein